jgi:sulfur carrier protein ThiS
MDDTKKKPESAETQPEDKPLPCSCNQDPFAALPPELRPRPKNLMGGLRKVTCPGCGLVYWTNRNSDLCMDCEKKGVHVPDASDAGKHEPEVIKRNSSPARIRPLGKLKKYIGDQAVISVEPGRTVHETLVALTIPPDLVALVIVNETMQSKDYCIQENDEIKLLTMMSGG